MHTITRRDFIDRLARRGPININEIDSASRRELEKAGLDTKALRRVAGGDQQIRGRGELKRLFALLDRSDSDGSRRSLESRDASGRATRAGKACAALVAVSDAQQRKASQRGILYVGMRPASKAEADTLRRGSPAAAGGLKALSGGASRTLRLDGESYDLDSTRGLMGLRHALRARGISDSQVQRLSELIARSDTHTRPLLIEVALALHAIGRGELPINRLVLSGHSAGDAVLGDFSFQSLSYARLAKLARLFPAGAKKIEHVALAACNSGHPYQVELFRRAFPNLKSFFGYHDAAPLAERGGARHLKQWERMTDGDDPSRVDPRGMHHVSTWNIADGYRGKRAEPLAKLKRRVNELRAASYDKIRSGAQKVEDVRRMLDAYYQAVTDLLYHPRLPSARHTALRAHQQEVLKLRHPEMFR